MVTLPVDLPSGPVSVRLRIVPDPSVPDAGSPDNNSARRGANWEELTVVTPVPAGTTDLSQVDLTLNTQVAGTLTAPGQADSYPFTVTTFLGSGRLTATVATTTPNFVPRLTLLGPDGQVLIQSDNGQIVQALQPGSYSLVVTARSGIGSYRLTSAFVQADPPLDPLPVGALPQSVAVADVNGDGIPDLLVANQASDQVTVQEPGPGNAGFAPVVTLGDGTQAAGFAPGAVRWARLDPGSPYVDAIVVQSGSNDVLVYRGTGFDAAGRPTFAVPQAYFVGTDPVSVTVASLGDDLGSDLLPGVAGPVRLVDSTPDLVVANQGSNDVSLLFGHVDADGHWYATAGPRLKSGGFGPVAVDVRQPNGNLQLVVTNGGSGTITGLPGVGQGFFNDQSPATLANLGASLSAAPVFLGPPGTGVAATTDGRLVGFNLNTSTADTVFTPPPGAGVAAVQPLPNGDLVVAEQGGTVEMLALNAGSSAYQPVADFESLTGLPPSEPSALAVLESGEVLVTNEGEDQLFVFGLASPSGGPTVGVPSPVPSSIVLPVQAVAANAVAEPSSPREAPLALVVTLVADVLPVGPGAAPGGNGPVPVAAADADNAGPKGVAPATADPAGGASDEEDDTQPQEPLPGNTGSVPDIPEILRQLKLYRRTEDDASGQPISRIVPELPAEPDSDPTALASLPPGSLGDPTLAGSVAASLPGMPRTAVRVNCPEPAVPGVDDYLMVLALGRPHLVTGRDSLSGSAEDRVLSNRSDHGVKAGAELRRGREEESQMLAALAAVGLAAWAERGLLPEETFSDAPHPPRRGHRPDPTACVASSLPSPSRPSGRCRSARSRAGRPSPARASGIRRKRTPGRRQPFPAGP
jgi:hypothetical protein